MTTRILLFFALLTTALCRAEQTTPYTITGQPSIFWRNGEWQTFQDGQWIPYSAPKHAEVATEPEPEMAIEPPLLSQPQDVQPNDYPIYYSGYGYAYPYGHRLHRHDFDKRTHLGRKKDDPFFQQPNAGLGRTTIGIGQQSGGLGRTTIGIGQPNGGIGQTTIGIGQPNTRLGKTTIGIGQPTFATQGNSAASATAVGHQSGSFARPSGSHEGHHR